MVRLVKSLENCIFTGDPSVQEYEGRHLVYVAAGTDPYSLIENSVKYVQFSLICFIWEC